MHHAADASKRRTPEADAPRVVSMSLLSRLRWAALGTLLPIFAFAVVGAAILAQRERATFELGARDRMLALGTAVDSELKSPLATLEALAASRSLDNDDLARFYDEAHRVANSQPDWIAVHLALPSGQEVVNTLRSPGAELPSVPERESFDAATRTGQPVVGNLTERTLSGQLGFPVRVPVTRSGQLKYVLTAEVKPAAIHELLAAQRLPNNWVGVVIDRNARIVARTVAAQQSAGQIASESLRAALARAPEGWFHGQTIEGTEVYTPYHRSTFSGWTVAMGVPASVVEGVGTRAFLVVVLGSVAVIVIALVLADVLSRRITGPIATLAAAARALARGDYRPIPPSGPITELADLGHALEQAVGASAEKERTKRQLAAVADNATVALFMLDERQHCTFMNPAAERMTGFTLSEVQGRTLHDVIHHTRPDGRPYPIDECPMDRAFPSNDRQQGEDMFVRKDGHFCPVAYTASPIRIDGRPVGTIIEVRDITVEKAAEANRLELLDREQRARAEAESANRAKDEFLAMLGHELRNPLAAIHQASFVLETDVSTQQSAAAKGIIKRQVAHLTRLVDDLLDVGRVAAGKIAISCVPVDMAELVGRALETLRASGASAAHRMTSNLESAWVEGDPTRLEQVVMNLLGNALRYTPPGGTIAVSVSVEGHESILSVADTGIGIPPELLSRIFDLFVQGHRGIERSQGGLGIGLTLVRRLVELHGGRVQVTSAGTDQGSTFEVRLPRRMAPITDRETRNAATSASMPRRILVVEDNADAREMLRLALELTGHEVVARADGPAGLATAIQMTPDVALVDIGLPGLDGFGVARGIRAASNGDRPLLIALTGYGQPEDRERALNAGFDCHLVKPVDTEALLHTISTLAPRG